MEFALLGVEEDFSLTAPLEEPPDCWNVAPYVRSMDVGIVQVAKEHFQWFWFVVQVIVDELLEVGWCIH